MGKGSKQKNVFDVDTINRLKGVALPPKIKCDRCAKFMGHNNYSSTQLTTARMAVRNKGVNATYRIKCQRCTGGRLVELECTMCLETKGLEDFAKIQARKPDTAKCYACMEDQLETTPIADEIYDDPRNAYIPVESSGGNYPEYWSNQSAHSTASETGDQDYEGSDADDEDGGVSLNNGMRNFSISETNTGTLIESDVDGGPVKDDGWQVASNSKSWHTRSTAVKTGALSLSSGFDPNKYGKPTNRGGSVSGTSRSFSTNVTERSNTVNKNGFPKIRAYKEVKTPEPEPEEDDWKSESEEEDNDSDDDDDDSDIEI